MKTKYFIFLILLLFLLENILYTQQEDTNIAKLKADLQSNDPDKVFQAVMALGEIGEKAKSAMPLLKNVLKNSKDKKLRIAILSTIDLIDPESLSNALEISSPNASPHIPDIKKFTMDNQDQLAAIKVLANMAVLYGSQLSEFQNAIEPISKILANPNKSKPIRNEAARYLGLLPMYASQEAVDAMKKYIQEQQKLWQEEFVKHIDIPEDVQKRMNALSPSSKQESSDLSEQMKQLAHIYNEYNWLQIEGLQKIKEYESLVAKKHERGKAFLERAKSLAIEKRHFEAKMTACCAIGFEGYGNAIPEFPTLLKKNSPEEEEARELINRLPDCRLLWNSKEFPSIRGLFQAVLTIAYSPDGKYLAAGSENRTIKIWNISTQQEIVTLSGHAKGVSSIAYSPDGKYLASGSYDSKIKIWDMHTHQEIATFSGHAKVVHSIAYSPDGKYLASGSGDFKIKIWDMHTHQEIATLLGYSEDGINIAKKLHHGYKPSIADQFGYGIGVKTIAYSPDGKKLASGCDEGTIRIWDTTAQKTILKLQGWKSSGNVSSLMYSPDGQYLAASHEIETTIKIWDTTTGKETANFKGHPFGVKKVAYSPDGQYLASACRQNTKIWHIASNDEMTTMPKCSEFVFSISYSPDGKTLALGENGTVRLWDVSIGREIINLRQKFFWGSGYDMILYNPNGKNLAAISSNYISLWDVATGQNIANRIGDVVGLRVHSIAYSPDGTKLAFRGGWNNTIAIWDIESNKQIASFSGHSYEIRGLAYSPDGKKLASGDLGKTIKIWDTMTGKEVAILKGDCIVNSMAYSPDGKTLATGNENNTIRIWDTISYKEIITFHRHSKPVNIVAYSPDGKTLASGSDDKTIKIWDIASLHEIMTLTKNYGSVKSLAYSPDGRNLISGDGKINIWDILTGKCIASYSFASTVAYHPGGRYIASSSTLGTSCIKIWNTIEAGYMDYSQYAQFCKFSDLSLFFVLPESGSSFSIPQNSYISILQGKDAQEEKDVSLCIRYLWAGNLKSALFIFKSLPEEYRSKELYSFMLERVYDYLEKALQCQAVIIADYLPLLEQSERQEHLDIVASLYARQRNIDGFKRTLSKNNDLLQDTNFGRKILEYYNNSLSLDTLYSIASQENSEKHLRLWKYYYYVGLYLLAKNDTVKAKEYLVNCMLHQGCIPKHLQTKETIKKQILLKKELYVIEQSQK